MTAFLGAIFCSRLLLFLAVLADKNFEDGGDLSMVQSARCMNAAAGTGAGCTEQAGLWNYARHFTYNAAGALKLFDIARNSKRSLGSAAERFLDIQLKKRGTAFQPFPKGELIKSG